MKSVGISLALGGMLLAAFGVGAFFMINQWGVDYEQRKAIIQSGEVPSKTLTIQKKHSYRSGTGSNSKIRYQLVLLNPDGEKYTKSVLNRNAWEALQPNDQLEGYRFEDRYHIPSIDTGGHHWGKWVFLGIGCFPSAIGLILIVIANKRATKVATT